MARLEKMADTMVVDSIEHYDISQNDLLNYLKRIFPDDEDSITIEVSAPYGVMVITELMTSQLSGSLSTT